MTVFNSIISRADAQALIPEQVSAAILNELQTESAALRFFRRVPVSTNQTRMPVLSALPVAYFVSGDNGPKQTTEANWDNKYLNVEEIAAIVPIPEAVLDDTAYDIWGTIRPLMSQAIGRALDNAVFFGVNKPASWPDEIVTGASSAGNVYTRGTSTQAQGGIAEDINQLFGTVEADGFDVNGIVTSRTYRSRLRSARDTTGQKILDMTTQEIDGVPVSYAMPGQWPTGTGAAEMIAGDFMQGIIGIRQDITYKLITEGVITDNASPPLIIYNLPQQDMVALRVVFRVAFQVANTLTYEQGTEASRYPFGVMIAP